MKNIGLLGGSFDPPHRGHVYISLEAKKILSLDEIWWLVTPQNPLKISKPATYSERINNCKRITKGQPITIKEVEKKICSKYTYQTIKYLQNHYSMYVNMTPDQYLNLAKQASLTDPYSKKSIAAITKGVMKGKKVAIPFLEIEISPNGIIGRVIGHEGRHRATVAKNINGPQSTIPVAIKFNLKETVVP